MLQCVLDCATLIIVNADNSACQSLHDAVTIVIKVLGYVVLQLVFNGVKLWLCIVIIALEFRCFHKFFQYLLTHTVVFETAFEHVLLKGFIVIIGEFKCRRVCYRRVFCYIADDVIKHSLRGIDNRHEIGLDV